MASVVDTKTKFYDETMPGAPAFNFAAGENIAIFHACLVTGFGERAVATLSVANGVATLSFSTPEAKNANLLHAVVSLQGITGIYAALNGEQRITATSDTSLSFATNLDNGTATGAITVKVAPAGWERVFYSATTNVAVFRSLNPQSSGQYIQMKDSGNMVGVRCFNTMTDEETGIGMFPPATKDFFAWKYFSDYGHGDSSNDPWDVFADDRAFFYGPAIYNAYATRQDSNQCVNFFGDIVPGFTMPNLPCVCTGADVHWGGSNFNAGLGNILDSYISTVIHVQGVGSATTSLMRESGHNTYSGTVSGLDAILGLWPCPDGKMRLSKVLVGGGASIYGYLPGLYHMPMHCTSRVYDKKSLITMPDGRVLRAISVGNYNSRTLQGHWGVMWMDITAPWRPA